MKKLLFAIIAVAVIISGCNKTEIGGPGRLSVKITDDPFDISSVESATITISKIEIRQTGADEGDPFIELLMDPVTINIFELRNGITQELVNLEVPKGDYDLVRIYVDEANLKLKDINEPFNLKVPSGEQTGIKLFISPVIHVEGGISAELLLDFDLSKSFVMRGHDAKNGFIFKPTIRAANNSVAGRIEGYVKDNSTEKIGIENAEVSFQDGAGETVKTLTDASGHYAFIGVPAGTYSLSATKENYVGAGVEGVVVVPGNKTAADDIILIGLPVYVSSVIGSATPSIIEMTFSLTLADIVPDVSAFAVTVATVGRTVSSVAVSGKIVNLTLASAVAKGEVVTVAYTKPEIKPLQTPDGLQVPTFTAKNVTNNVN